MAGSKYRKNFWNRNEYSLSGTVFSDDGAGNPYYILDDMVYEYDPIDNESNLMAETIIEFFT